MIMYIWIGALIAFIIVFIWFMYERIKLDKLRDKYENP